MVVRDDASFQFASQVRGGAVIVSVLSTYTPTTCLPERTQVLGVVGPRLIAFEAIREDWLLWATAESLPQHGASVSIFTFAIRWSLTCKNARNV